MEHRPFCRCFSDSLMKDGNFRSHVSSGGYNCRNYLHDLKELLEAIRVQHRGIMFSQRSSTSALTDVITITMHQPQSSHGTLRTKGDAWRKTRQWWRDLVNQTQTFPPWADELVGNWWSRLSSYIQRVIKAVIGLSLKASHWPRSFIMER